jgi:hypothetical protein
MRLRSTQDIAPRVCHLVCRHGLAGCIHCPRPIPKSREKGPAVGYVNECVDFGLFHSKNTPKHRTRLRTPAKAPDYDHNCQASAP